MKTKVKPDLNMSRMGDPYRPSFDLLHGLDDLCVRHIKPRNDPVLLEIGSYNGVSTSLFAYYCKKVVSIDPQYLDTMKEVLKNHDNIEFHNDYSSNIVPSFEDESFDVVYIDGFHNYENAMRDILLCIPKLKKDGIMTGHDYHQNHPGVVLTVNHLIQSGLFVNPELYADSSWSVTINRKDP